MAVTEMTPDTHEGAGSATTPAPTVAGGLERLLGTGDHTSIGRLYVGSSLVFIVAALLARALVGVDFAAEGDVLGTFSALVGNSSLVALVVLGVVPLLLGMAIHMVPLQVGSPTIAFPRAAALSFWGWLVFAAIFVTSAAIDGGFGGNDPEATRLGNVAFGAVVVALGLGSVCVATTVMAHRPKGMSLARVPLYSWSMLVASVIWILSFGTALAYVILTHLIAESAPAYLENFSAGLGWLLRGPAVFMVAIPVLGIAADVTATVSGRPLKNYGVFQGLIAAFGVFSFGAWAIGPASLNSAVWAVFALLVAVPVLGLLGGLAESLRHGPVKLTAALIGSLLALVNILGAVVVGLLMALNNAGTGTLFDFLSVELAPAQTVFVFTAALTGALAGLAHWSVKFWGSEAKESTAKASLAMVDLGGLVLAVSLAVEVLARNGGEPTAVVVFGALGALGAIVLLLGAVGAIVASLGSAKEADDVAPADPWGGLTLEWQTPSPAAGGARTNDLPEIDSPYPLLAAEEGN